MGTTSYTPSSLQPERVYYWRVDEFDGVATHKGDVWAFTTPGAAGNPQPANRATGVQRVAKLNCTPATTATSHQVYLGNAVWAPFIFTSGKVIAQETATAIENYGNRRFL